MKKEKKLPWMREDFWKTHFWRKAIVCMLVCACLLVGFILVLALVPFFQSDVWYMNISGLMFIEIVILPLYLEKKRPGHKAESDSLMGIAMIGLNILCLFLACVILGLIIGLVSRLLNGVTIDPDLIDFHP